MKSDQWFNNLETGASNSNYDITDLNQLLHIQGMPALGAVSLTDSYSQK